MDGATGCTELCRPGEQRGEVIMQKMKWILMLALWLGSGNILAQVGQQRVDAKETLDAEREKHALQIFLKLGEKLIVSAAEAIPTDKYVIGPTNVEFKRVKS